MNYMWRRNKRIFGSKQEFKCAPSVPSGDKILRHLEWIVFGDESASKEPKPTKKSKTDSKKKQKKQKKTPKNLQLVTNEKV
jgi:hypothetical protein